MAEKIKCPSCQKELDRVGYIEHGTKTLKDGEWQEIDAGGDCTYYCLECSYDFDPEDLEAAGII